MENSRNASFMTRDRDRSIRVGVSACLIGERVRYDGGHKRTPLIADVLPRFLCLVPCCPEVGLGLGTPRNTLDLVEGTTGPRLVMTEHGKDYTQDMERWASAKVEELKRQGLCGFILKSKSPSCALADARVLDHEGRPAGFHPGLFTAVLRRAHSGLPLIDEVELRNPESLFIFLERVLDFALHSRPSLEAELWGETTRPGRGSTEP